MRSLREVKAKAKVNNVEVCLETKLGNFTKTHVLWIKTIGTGLGAAFLPLSPLYLNSMIQQ